MEHLPGPSGLPLVGNVGIDTARFHRQLEDWARESGPVYRMRLMDRRFIVTSRHGDIAQILHDRPDQWRRSRRVAGILEEAAASGVFSAEGDEWRRQRKLVMHALTPEVLTSSSPLSLSLAGQGRKGGGFLRRLNANAPRSIRRVPASPKGLTAPLLDRLTSGVPALKC